MVTDVAIVMVSIECRNAESVYCAPETNVVCVSTTIKLNVFFRGAWVAQSFMHPTLAQVMISQFLSLSPTSGSALTVWSLVEIFSLFLSLPLPYLYFLSLKINK